MFNDLMDTIGFVSAQDPDVGAAMEKELARQREKGREQIQEKAGFVIHKLLYGYSRQCEKFFHSYLPAYHKPYLRYCVNKSFERNNQP